MEKNFRKKSYSKHFLKLCIISFLLDFSYFKQPKNLGRFLTNAYLILDENSPGSADVLLHKTRELLTFDKLHMDLMSISKLFLLNDFENIDFTQFAQLRSCYESVLETQSDPILPQNDVFFKSSNNEIIQRTPCKNLTKYPACEDYCNWHKEIISTGMLKKDFLELMRYLR